jgi:hypothetical protein
MVDETNFDSYLPLYDTVPEKWEEGRQFLIEVLKKISEMVNIREIGWYLDEELLSGKQLIPGAVNPQEYRSIFRKVLDCGPLVSGVEKDIPHGIVYDANFTLIQLFGAATNTAMFNAQPIPNNIMSVRMDAVNIKIIPDNDYDRSFCVIEYILEL